MFKRKRSLKDNSADNKINRPKKPKKHALSKRTNEQRQQVHPHNDIQYLQTNAVAISLLLTFISFGLGETIDHINETYDHNVAAQNEIDDLLQILDQSSNEIKKN